MKSLNRLIVAVWPVLSCAMLTFVLLQESDGEKSDDNLVVDVSNEVRRSFTRRRLTLWKEGGEGENKTKPSPLVNPPQDPSSPKGSPAHSPRENGLDKRRLLKKDAPLSPSSIASSSSTPSSKSKEISLVSHSRWPRPLLLLSFSESGSIFRAFVKMIPENDDDGFKELNVFPGRR